ncbi:hypothetical protein COCSUDRAFT_48772 [Coccomyxa subellipsoidea C-169]|uniref:Peroxisomal membrane protein PEX14 n=1 Tax=Coccomyxa subellipsoidea (strain C-169) TaxID=574566 RepID=I0YMB5_COCSC|nr:hypothetical protein COCSUDRAFT_48772 [Coccomyxa subellipsoidea C-169]EIE19534.1 hypothetical protein COCSUDRAFT_48772 [Coccomyxa subellipsoidea C-169]|eukprot:XP_005644078.1 hypothetical protein COCSUDRAFT_48772 [Coccomyxa subellipsoidea C-169]
MADVDNQEPGAEQGQDGTAKNLQDVPVDAAHGLLQASSPAASLREDQIQNAVSFLSHPKVRGSSAASKVSFLEKKGLTAAEIEEAFRRVPDTPTASVPAGSSGLPAQPAAQPPPKPFPTGTAATLQQLQPQPIAQPPQPIRWTQVVVGLGLVAALGYAVKEYALPKVSQWYKEWRSDSDKAAAEQKAEETARLVATAIQAQTAEMQKTLGDLKEAIGTLEKGKAAAVEGTPDTVTLAQLRSELRVLATSLNEFGSPAKAVADPAEGRKLDEIKTMVAMVAGQLSARPVPISTVQDPFTSPGVQTNGIQEICGASPFMANGVAENATAEPEPLPQPPHPASYMEVLEMLEKGQTPPGIRDDIVDVPPNPSAPPPGARMKPRPKPWERAASAPDSPVANGAFPATAAVPRTSSAGAFPPATRAAVPPADVERSPPRAPWADGGPSFAAQAAKPAVKAADQATSAKTAGASGSSSSPPADAWKPPAVPQPSIPRPVPAAHPVSPPASVASADAGISTAAGAASPEPESPAQEAEQPSP